MTSANNTPSLPSNRRPSYATVAAGVHPSRMNTLAAFGTLQNTSAASLPPQHPPGHSPPMSRQQSRSSLRSMEIDGQGTGGWRRPTSSWSNDVARLDGTGTGKMGCTLHDEHPSWFTPSYLHESRHVQKLQRQHEEHMAELAENLALNPPPRQPSRDSSSANLSKMAAQHVHRGIVGEVYERLPPPPVEEEGSHFLPTKWSEMDKAPGLEILADGCEVRYNGTTKLQDEGAALRTDHPMPREIGIYYFEVTVLSRGKEMQIGIGFAKKDVPLTRLPGWEPNSWAYHGDDGFSFTGSPSGKPFGPKFQTLDVIGCGVNFRTGNAFFTKNGVPLGVAFGGIKENRLYPAVGLKKPGEHLRTNFGRSPFVFDIDRMMEDERRAIFCEVLMANPSSLHPPDDEDFLIHKLVGQYLAHEGYVETAKAFAQDVHDQQASLSGWPHTLQLPDPDEDIHASNRQKIRKSILDGDIDKALKYTNAFYPRVLEDERNKDIHFRLRCRKFIEMRRRYTELSAATSSPTAITKSVESIESNGHVSDGEHMADRQGITDTQMELDDQLNREASKGLDPPSIDDIDMDASQELTQGISPKASYMKRLDDLENRSLDYGRELESTFGDDPRRKKQLETIFSLMAYTNPMESPVGHLLDPKGRVSIAEEVNGAILVSLGKPPSAALEKLCAQTEALLEETAAKTGSAAAFVNVRTDFLQP